MPQNPLQNLAIETLKRLGIKGGVPQTTSSVDVVAKRPSPDAPYPKNLPEILLGTPTEPPSGVYLGEAINPSPTVKTASDQEGAIYRSRGIPTEARNSSYTTPVQQAWNRFRADHPAVSRLVKSLQVDPTLWGTSTLGYSSVDHPGTIGVNPMAVRDNSVDDLEEVLAHEVTHLGQRANFPPPAQPKWWQDQKPPWDLHDTAWPVRKPVKHGDFVFSDPIPYEDRPSEQQAFEVENQLTDRRYDKALLGLKKASR